MSVDEAPPLDPAMPEGTEVMLLEQIDTDGFSAVGVSWQGAAPSEGVKVEIRVRLVDSDEWTSWETMSVAEGYGTTTEPIDVRQGTDPWWFGESDGVQVAVSVAPDYVLADAKLTLIDPKQASQDAQVGAPQIGQAGADVPQPQVYSRAQWGADESKRSWDPQYAGTIKAATVHHSADSNAYTADQVPAVLRSIYQYQAVTLGWGDIGYNVVVDKFGRAWEGRAGGLSSSVIGAHAGGFNQYTFGVSMLGNYDLVQVPMVVTEKLAELIAWKFQKYSVDPNAAVQLTQRGGNGTTAKFYDGYVATLPAIFGHRQVGSTACPGQYGYASLPLLRQRVTQIMAAHPLTATSPTPRTMLVNTGGVPIYAGPGTTTGVVGGLTSGAIVQTSAVISNGMVSVSAPSAGWVELKYLVDNPDEARTLYTTTGGIPVYFGPSSAYRYAGTIDANEALAASNEEVNGYVHVRFGAHGGWIAKKWTTTTKPAGAITPGGVPNAIREYYTNTSGIPVRSSPSSSSSQLASMPAGVVMQGGYGNVEGWVHVQYGWNGGWIKRDYLAFNANPTKMAATTTGGVPLYLGPGTGYYRAATLGEGALLPTSDMVVNGYAHVTWGRWGGWVPTKWLATHGASDSPDTSYTTNTNGVPVYAESNGSAVVATLSAGEAIQGWSTIQDGRVKVVYASGKSGWVPANWLVSNPASVAARYTITNGVPVHLGPGTEYMHAGNLAQLTQVSVSTAQPVDGWVNIRYGNTGGWVPEKWLGSNPVVSTQYYTNTAGVPVYLGPGSGYASLGTLPAANARPSDGQVVDGYVHVTYGQTGGWVPQKWLIRNPATVATKTAITSGIPVHLGPGTLYYRAGEISVDTPVKIGSVEQDGWVQIVYGSTGGWVQSKWLGTQPAATTNYYTNTGGVPLMQGPGAGYAQLGQYPALTKVSASTGSSNGYIHIVFGSSGAWIKSQWLVQNPTAVAIKTAITSGIPVHLGPGAAYHRIGEIGVGTSVQVGAATQDGWIQVVFGSTGGWVSSKWLT